MAVITSTGNAAVKAARKLARGPARHHHGAFIVEGPQAVREAGEHLLRLFVTDQARRRYPELVRAAETAGAETLAVTDAVLASMSDTQTPQGIVGVARLPRRPLTEALAGSSLVVALWEAQDPGNVGSVLRSADAAGADAVVLTVGSADPRTPKVVRASAGSLFHLPVVVDAEPGSVLDGGREHGLRVIALVPGVGAAHTDVDLSAPTLVLLGNEARGLPPGLIAGADESCHVPMRGRATSLNLAAAAAVVLFEAARQRSVRGSVA